MFKYGFGGFGRLGADSQQHISSGGDGINKQYTGVVGGEHEGGLRGC